MTQGGHLSSWGWRAAKPDAGFIGRASPPARARLTCRRRPSAWRCPHRACSTGGSSPRVRLLHIASATKTLASGEKVTYQYARRGGPRLKGEPGSPEFILSYEQAHRGRKQSNPSLFKSIIAGYLASP